MGEVTPHQKWARDAKKGLKILLDLADKNQLAGFVCAFEQIDGDGYVLGTLAAGELDDVSGLAGHLFAEAVRLSIMQLAVDHEVE